MKIGSDIIITREQLNINLCRQRPFLLWSGDDVIAESNYATYAGDSFKIVDIHNDEESKILNKIYIIRHNETGLVFKCSAIYFKQFWDILQHGYCYRLTDRDNYLIHSISRIVITNIDSINCNINFMHSGVLRLTPTDNYYYTPSGPGLTVIPLIDVRFPDEETLRISPGYSTNAELILQKLGYDLYSKEVKKSKNISFKVDTTYQPIEIIISNNDGKTMSLSKYYGFILNYKDFSNGKKAIAYYKKDNKYVLAKDYYNIKLIDINNISQATLNALLNACFKASILNADKSIELFQNKRKKLSMFEESKNGKLFNIRAFIKDYKCKVNGEVCNVVELKHGNIALKFVDSDLNLICDNLKGINPPKDRTIEKGVECKVIRNKNLPLSLGSKVKVVKVNKLGKFVKNVVVTSDNKDNLICSIKNLKRI